MSNIKVYLDDNRFKEPNTVLAAVEMGLWELDLQSESLHCSSALGKILGCEPTALTWPELAYSPQDADAVTAGIKRCLADGNFSAECRLRDKNGEALAVELRGAAADGYIRGVFQACPGMSAATARERELANLRKKAEFNFCPDFELIYDEGYSLIDCDANAPGFFGCVTKAELLSLPESEFIQHLGTHDPDVTPIESLNDRILCAFTYGECECEYWIQRTTRMPMYVIMRREVLHDDKRVVIAYHYNLLRQRFMRGGQSLLNAVNQVAEMLLFNKEKTFEETVERALEKIGLNFGVDRAYIWQNSLVDGVVYSTQIYEWVISPDMKADEGYIKDVPLNEATDNWAEKLSSGGCINSLVSNMSEMEQRHLEPQGIVSILVAPIFFNSAFWGFIGLDDCKNKRVFTETEESILKSVGSMLAFAFLRNAMTDSLIESTEQALQSTSAKSMFLANMSHEIRTPISVIIGMTQIAQKTTDRKHLEEHLHKINIASKHLLSVINDILDMSKIEANKFELYDGEFSLRAMVAEVVGLMEVRFSEKNQHFSLDIGEDVPDHISADEVRIGQVITNLLSNANKFTPKGGCISLDITLMSRDSGFARLRLTISDSGIGIAPERIALLFTPFEQADGSTSRQYGGTGLGLSICKRIVELSGGDIWAESEPGKGSRFIFTLGVKVLSGEFKKAAMDSASSCDLAGRRILLAEDIEINQEIVISMLEESGVDIDCAVNGQEALDMFSKAPDMYDLILMDVQMPVLDGWRAAERIRALGHPKAKAIPIIAMTANAFNEDIARSLESGMNDHISKPFSPQEFITKIGMYLA